MASTNSDPTDWIDLPTDWVPEGDLEDELPVEDPDWKHAFVAIGVVELVLLGGGLVLLLGL